MFSINRFIFFGAMVFVVTMIRYCHHLRKDNRNIRSRFKCVECGYLQNADWVGVLNVLALGCRVLACGVQTMVLTMKRNRWDAAIHAQSWRLDKVARNPRRSGRGGSLDKLHLFNFNTDQDSYRESNAATTGRAHWEVLLRARAIESQA